MSNFRYRHWQDYRPLAPQRPWKEFMLGFGYMHRGYRFIRQHPRLWLYALPSILCYLPVFFIFLAYFPALLFKGSAFLFAGITPLWSLWYWQIIIVLGALFIILPIAFFILILLVSVLVVATLVASVFNDLLAEKTESLYRDRPKEEVPFSLERILKSPLIVMVEELKKLGFYFSIQAVFMLWSFIPVFGQIVYVLLGGLFSVLFLGFEYVDYPLARRLVPFGEKKTLVSRYAWRMFGFGSMVSVMLLIPIVNAFAMAIAVIGATLLFVDLGVYQGIKPGEEEGKGSETGRMIKSPGKPR